VKYLKLVLNFLVLGFLVAPFFLAPRLIVIREVTCQSQFGPCNQILLQKIKEVENKNLSEAKSALKEELSRNALVKNFQIQLKLPGKLRIDLVERKPKYALRSLQRPLVALVDGEGYVLSMADLSSLPTVETSEPVANVGEKVTDENLFALELVDDIYSAYQVQTGKIENGSLTIEVKEGLEAIFPLEGDRQVLVGSLALILTRLNTEEGEYRIDGVEKARQIDLRYKNPVVR
jgi:cell division septal protein FtsQ